MELGHAGSVHPSHLLGEEFRVGSHRPSDVDQFEASRGDLEIANVIILDRLAAETMLSGVGSNAELGVEKRKIKTTDPRVAAFVDDAQLVLQDRRRKIGAGQDALQQSLPP